MSTRQHLLSLSDIHISSAVTTFVSLPCLSMAGSTSTMAETSDKTETSLATSIVATDTWTTAHPRHFLTTTGEFFLDDHHVLSVHISFAAITLLYIPFILVNNNLVLWSTILFRKLHTPNNLMLASLAVADLIMGLFCIPMYALSYIPSTQHLVKSSGKYACLAWFASIELGGAGSLKNLLLITLDRFIAVEFPLSYNKIMTMKTTVTSLILLWVYVVIMTIVPFLGWNRYDPNVKDPNKRCNYYLTLPEGYVIWASFFTITVCISIPLLLNIKIFYTVCKQQKSMRMYEHLWSSKQIKRLRDRFQTVRITGILCLLFIMFWLPYVLVAPLKYTSLSPRDIEIIKVVVQLLYFLNSVVNAPIYALMRSEYKIAYYLLLTTPICKWGTLKRHCLAPETPLKKPNDRVHENNAIANGTFQTPLAITPSIHLHPVSQIDEVKSVNELPSNEEGPNTLRMTIRREPSGYTNSLMVAAEVEETTLTIISSADTKSDSKSLDVRSQASSSTKLNTSTEHMDNPTDDQTKIHIILQPQHPHQKSTPTTPIAPPDTITSAKRRHTEKDDNNRLSVHNARRYIKACSGKITPLTLPEPADEVSTGQTETTVRGDVSHTGKDDHLQPSETVGQGEHNLFTTQL